MVSGWQLKQRQGLPLNIKIQLSQRRIRDWIAHWGKDKVYVSFSGGKDSTVLLHLVRSVCPEVKGVFIDTGLEYPEIREFVRTKENIETLRPKKTFPQVLKDYGYPVISKNVSRYVHDLQNPTLNNLRTRETRLGKTGSAVGTLSKKWMKLVDAPFSCSDECCNVMKKRPVRKYEKENDMKPFLGLMAGESRARNLKFIKNGCNSFDTKYPQSNPMSFWTEQDILKYIVDNKLDYCKVYGEIKKKNKKYTLTGVKRTGCMFCMFGVHMEESPNRFQQMEKSHPVIHNYCINKLGCGKVLNYIGIPFSNDSGVE